MRSVDRRAVAALAATIWIVGAASTSAAKDALSTRSLIVVIWERRAPVHEVVAGRYGIVQQRNREALVSLLYGGDAPLIRDLDSTIVAIYPEGTMSFVQQRDRIQAIEAMQPQDIWKYTLPTLVATPESDGLVRGLFWESAPERSELDREIRRNITYPLVGLLPHLADYSGFDESGQRGVDHAAARAVSNPPFVTAWTLFDAAARASAERELLSPVYVIWVHAGERNYAITNPRQRILNDYGPGSRALYVDTLSLYSLLPDEAHGVDGELADGNVKVWRVLPRRAVREPPQAGIRVGRMPASMSWERSGVWANPLLGNSSAARSFHGSVESLYWPAWSHRIETEGYTRVAGRYRFEKRGVSAAMDEHGFVERGLRRFVEKAFPVGTTSWHVDDDAFAETLLEADIEKNVPDYLRSAALRIAILHRTHPASVSIHVSSLHPIWTWATVIAILLAICIGLARLRHRRARRALTGALDFGGSDDDEVIVEGPLTTASTTARLTLLDRSGFRPWSVNIPLKIDLTSPLGDVALSGAAPLHTIREATGNPVRSGKQKPKREDEARVTTTQRPSRRHSPDSGLPLDIRLQAAALDFGHLTAGEEVRGVYTLAVTADDETGRYENFRQEFARRFRLQIKASSPEPVVEIVVAEPVRRLALFGDPEAAPDSLEQPFGQFKIRNPPLAQGVALDIDVKIDKALCVVESEDGSHRELVHHSLFPVTPDGLLVEWKGEKEVTVKNNGTAVSDIVLRLPHGSEWKKQDRWTIRFSAEVTITWPGGKPKKESLSKTAVWLPVGARSFACLDLGTSATRLLVQGQEEEKFGYLVFPPEVRTRGGPVEDLPATTWIDLKKRVVKFGGDARRYALAHPDGEKLYPSLKELMLTSAGHYSSHVELYIEQLLRRFYGPSIHQSAEKPDAEVVNPYTRTPPQVWRGTRDILIGTIPNEASRELIASYERAVQRSGFFRRFLHMREAEAAAFGYIYEASLRRPRVSLETMKVLVVDVGAGSTDVALIESNARELTVISRGGVRVAGNHVDRAILEVLPKIVSFRNAPRGTGTNTELPIEQARELKIAMSQGASGMNFDAGDLIHIDAEKMEAIFQSAEYQQTLREIIDEPLLMLLGRTPEVSKLRNVDVLLLTGRGSLIRGVRHRVKETLKRMGITPRQEVFDERGNGTFLKAAVTLGARTFGLGPWPTMTLSNDTFADRIVFVAATADGPQCVEIVPTGQPFDAHDAVSSKPKLLPFHGWGPAALIRTCLRTDGDFGDEVRLTPVRMQSILLRTQIEGMRMAAYTSVGGFIPVREEREGPVSLSVTVHANDRVEWQFHDAPQRRRTGR
jgi:actin-like ATPase involved in cell morphogenesis